MDIYVYSDESGVFDPIHERWYVYGGIMILSKEDKDQMARMYSKAEKDVRAREILRNKDEVKASKISNDNKGKLFRSLNNVEKFGVVIDLKQVLKPIYDAKKSKQRYLDYAYKIAVKRKFEDMLIRGVINRDEVKNIFFNVDEHSTATNGRYELREAMEQEFKFGTYNMDYSHYFPPIFPDMSGLSLQYCNSSKTTLVRAADIIANRLYHAARAGAVDSLEKDNFKITRLHKTR